MFEGPEIFGPDWFRETLGYLDRQIELMDAIDEVMVIEIDHEMIENDHDGDEFRHQ